MYFYKERKQQRLFKLNKEDKKKIFIFEERQREKRRKKNYQ